MDTQRFKAGIAAAIEASPMTLGNQPVVPGRVLLVDGDGLCYFCAGKDGSAAGEARVRLKDKVLSAMRAVGAERARILVTASGSHKGHRYAIATRKPYQGQRSGSRRPDNWLFLRTYLTEDNADLERLGMQVVLTSTAEADDLFGSMAATLTDCVIYTQDKDMRMIPGVHLDWSSHVPVTLKPGVWAIDHNDKRYGRSWFWLQLLQGDTADNIPGLPKFVTADGKEKLIGEKTALDKLTGVESDMGALLVVSDLYQSYYKERWLVELLEQGILLWMRNDSDQDPFNVTETGNPFDKLRTHELWGPASQEIQGRIDEARKYDQVNTIPDSIDEDATVVRPRQEVCLVQAGPTVGEDSTGPRPFDGTGPGCITPDVQCLVGQSGEQLPPLRCEQPSCFPSWLYLVLAKARV